MAESNAEQNNSAYHFTQELRQSFKGGAILINGEDQVVVFSYGQHFTDADIAVDVSPYDSYLDANAIRESLILQCFASTHPSRKIEGKSGKRDFLRVKDIIFRVSSSIDEEMISSKVTLASQLGAEIDADTPVVIVGSQFGKYLTRNNRIQTSRHKTDEQKLPDASSIIELMGRLTIQQTGTFFPDLSGVVFPYNLRKTHI